MMHGFDRTDEDMIFGAVVRQAYLFADCVLLVFNFRDEVGDLARNKVRAPGIKKVRTRKRVRTCLLWCRRRDLNPHTR